MTYLITRNIARSLKAAASIMITSAARSRQVQYNTILYSTIQYKFHNTTAKSSVTEADLKIAEQKKDETREVCMNAMLNLTDADVCMYVCMYVCAYVCMYICICVCEGSFNGFLTYKPIKKGI